MLDSLCVFCALHLHGDNWIYLIYGYIFYGTSVLKPLTMVLRYLHEKLISIEQRFVKSGGNEPKAAAERG